MWRFTCLPRTVYDFLYPFKPLFRCSQARHFVIFCWFLVAIIRDPGAGTLKGLCPYLPPHLSYWALIRMLRSGKWDAQAVLSGMSKQVLRSLPPRPMASFTSLATPPTSPSGVDSIPWDW